MFQCRGDWIAMYMARNKQLILSSRILIRGENIEPWKVIFSNCGMNIYIYTTFELKQELCSNISIDDHK